MNLFMWNHLQGQIMFLETDDQVSRTQKGEMHLYGWVVTPLLVSGLTDPRPWKKRALLRIVLQQWGVSYIATSVTAGQGLQVRIHPGSCQSLSPFTSLLFLKSRWAGYNQSTSLVILHHIRLLLCFKIIKSKTLR